MDTKEQVQASKDVQEVCYIYGEDLIKAADALPVHRRCSCGKGRRRHDMVHELIKALALLQNSCKIVHVSRPLSVKDACLYHSKDYIEALLAPRNTTAELVKYNLVEDSSKFPGVGQHALWIAASTIQACEELLEKRSRIAINWFGGRHHAMRANASGFCYINDVVLGILKLQERFDYILCMDFDVHHGDGQESAFYFSDKVCTVSFHIYEKGFFPGISGDPVSSGGGKGESFNLNIPVARGMDGAGYFKIFQKTLDQITQRFQPDAIVAICGADCLKGDPRGGLNVLPSDLARCMGFLRQLKKPMLILGGGGYNFTETARCWACITSTLLKQNLNSTNIPEHKYFEYYGPSWSI